MWLVIPASWAGMKAAYWPDFGNFVIIAWSLCWLASEARPKSAEQPDHPTERRSHARGEHERWSKGEDSSDQGGDQGPDNHGVQERVGRIKARVRADGPVIAPHPSERDQMHQQHKGKGHAQRAGRPG